MCRLAAFPPGTKKDFAVWIMEEMVGGNTDGFGVAYLKSGVFVVDKTPKSFKDLVAKGNIKQFNHMPHSGWTIAHVRAKTHGNVEYRNTHPFVFKNYAFCHNGVFGDSEKIRKWLRYFSNQDIKWQGDTDSETVGYVLDTIGLDKVDEIISFGGVYLGLHKSGEVHVYKTSGDLEMAYLEKDDKGNIKEDGVVCLASDFPTKIRDQVKDSYSSGKIVLSADGKVKKVTGLTFSKKHSYDWKQGSLYGCSSDERGESYLGGRNVNPPPSTRTKRPGEDVAISVWNPECIVEDMCGDD